MQELLQPVGLDTDALHGVLVHCVLPNLSAKELRILTCVSQRLRHTLQASPQWLLRPNYHKAWTVHATEGFS